ncbi:hypothetical protein NDK47_08540 [Brevibacillus ruminantium]|uniref:Lipoprotein n=1 Tax=Brevibacillus ruminantium TaxID=2950604 RepID=A0ABY4WJK0_9BACL|nr:hypothetical protein [Brevibacillus ruminantium]USG67305.1 hypothetical protein NDK47_08540 [Brevibacillus ruminantium]
MNIRWIIFLLISLLVTGCGTPSLDEQLQDLAFTVKKIHYEVTDYTKIDPFEEGLARNELIKPYLTEKAYDLFYKNRESYFPLEVARQQSVNIQVKNLSLVKVSEENDLLTYHYTMDVELLAPDGSVKKTLNATGQMDFKKEGEGWKVARDWDGNLMIGEWEAGD